MIKGHTADQLKDFLDGQVWFIKKDIQELTELNREINNRIADDTATDEDVRKGVFIVDFIDTIKEVVDSIEK